MPGLEEYELFDDGHHVVMEGEQQYVTMTIAAQLFGVPIMQVEDIVEPDRITMVPFDLQEDRRCYEPAWVSCDGH